MLTAFGASATAQLPPGLFGSWGMEREGVLPIERGGVARSDRQRDIVGAVLLFEAGRPGRSNLCLRLAPEGGTFEQEKWGIRALEERVRGGEPMVAELERLRNPRRDWLRPRRDRPPEKSLAEPEARQLRLAEIALLGAPNLARVDLALDAGQVPAAFRSTDPGCNVLFFTAPAVAGEVAFVEMDYRCGPGCRESWLYAVVLRDERWVVEALSRMDPI